MSNLNFQVNAVCYSDVKPSNNPAIRIFDINYKLLGQSISRPKSEDFSIAPGATLSVFNGTRTTLTDGTSAFTVTKPVASENKYRFTYSAGTAPVFRTDRVSGVDSTTVLVLTVNGPIVTLTHSSGTALDTTNIQVGDILNILSNSGFSAANRGKFTILSKTSNSVSFQNLNASGETVTISSASDFLIYSNGGGVSNQIQIDDKVVISSGFSAATQGTYEVVEVTPTWFEIMASGPNGLPLESNVIPTSSGLIFYTSAKSFIMIAAQGKCSVKVNGDSSDNSVVEPYESNNPEKPGLYIKHGTCFSLSIKNLGLETLNVVIATAE